MKLQFTPFVLAGLMTGATGLASAQEINLTPLGVYESGIFDEGAAEFVAHDPLTQRLFVINANDATVDVLSITNPAQPALVGSISVTNYGAVANSVATFNGIIAVAVENEDKQAPGEVVFFDNQMNFLSAVQVGALPDMLTFTPDGKYVLVANEGEPDDDYDVDPEGSVSIIRIKSDVSKIKQEDVKTADFKVLNDAVLDSSIRIFGPKASVAQDLEPEYIVVSDDSKTAWVTCQENNAIAIVDIHAARVLELKGLGFKDHMDVSNKLDASDKDNVINIRNWPVWGIYMPDAIAAYTSGSETFLVMANEGDSRDYDGFSEEVRVKDLPLDPGVFPDAAELKMAENLGRLKTTLANGFNPGTGYFESIFSYGARSFSIRDTSGTLVYDSGDEIEHIVAAVNPDFFNSSNDENNFDGRSDDKGPEPEGVVIGNLFGKDYAFIGLERVGGVMVYDISNPYAPFFVTYVNVRDFTNDVTIDVNGEEVSNPEAGDLGPEGLVLITAEDSPNGQPLLVIGNEVSGTTRILQISQGQ